VREGAAGLRPSLFRAVARQGHHARGCDDDDAALHCINGGRRKTWSLAAEAASAPSVSSHLCGYNLEWGSRQGALYEYEL
jgi:hypothetical protein